MLLAILTLAQNSHACLLATWPFICGSNLNTSECLIPKHENGRRRSGPLLGSTKEQTWPRGDIGRDSLREPPWALARPLPRDYWQEFSRTPHTFSASRRQYRS